MKCYALGAQTRAAEVVQAFCEGVKGDFVRNADPKYEGGDIALWGLLRGAKALRAGAKAAGCDYYAMDHAYIGRERFFRCTKSGFQQTEVFDWPNDRWKHLVDHYRLEVADWRRSGTNILVALSSNMNYEYFDEIGWEGLIRQRLKSLTDRPIVIRKKGERESLKDQLKKTWIMVTHASIASVEAVIAGVPVVTLGPCAARPMSTPIEEMESPRFPERQSWFNTLAYSQFDYKEFRKGLAKAWVDEYPVKYSHYGW